MQVKIGMGWDGNMNEVSGRNAPRGLAHTEKEVRQRCAHAFSPPLTVDVCSCLVWHLFGGVSKVVLPEFGDVASIVYRIVPSFE